MPQFEGGWELVDGKLVEKTVPTGKHSLIARRLIRAQDRFDPDEKQGFMLQETSVKLGPHNIPLPDLCFWKAERSLKPDDGAMPRPDLAVEVHSPSDLKGNAALTRAMLKVKRLLEAGVPLVWVVYPNRQVAEVYQSAAGFEAGPVQVAGIADILDGAEVIPGFKVALQDLFS